MSNKECDYNIRQLTAAIVYQAVKDYCNKKTTKEERRVVLKDLRSPYMDLLTNGTSVIVARELELHPDEIKARIRKHKED